MQYRFYEVSCFGRGSTRNGIKYTIEDRFNFIESFLADSGRKKIIDGYWIENSISRTSTSNTVYFKILVKADDSSNLGIFEMALRNQ